MSLNNRVAIVTAAGRGLGKGIAINLAAHGATVIVNSYGEETTQGTVDEIKAAGGKAVGMPGDITSPERMLEVVNDTLSEFGQIDILVNNVGAGPKTADAPPAHPLGAIEGIWNALYRQNLLPSVLMTEAVTPHMIEKRSGRIINISSIAGKSTFSAKMLQNFTHPSYGAMKAALIHYTQCLAETLGPYSINANAVCPGIIYTDAWKANAERAVKSIPAYQGMEPREWFEGIFRDDYPDIFYHTPLQREQTVEDIANAVRFLASEDAINITGQTLIVDGGMIKL
jgi:3-oxoacyl-[acyl-carrier protein] reductase